MKVLITGGSGMLGWELNKTLSKKNEILSIYNTSSGNCSNFNSTKLDITNNTGLANLFDEFRPNIVVHTAAISNPAIADKTDPKIVNSVNITATENIAKLCDKFGAKLIYSSTDLVYGGYRGTLLDENSKLVPISLYAETKLMGEIKIQNTFDNYVILRTALLYGIGDQFSKNHFNQIYKKLKNNDEVTLFNDQFRSPLAFFDAANMIEQIIDLDIKNVILNFGGADKYSRYQLGKILCKETGLNPSLLISSSMNDFDFPYKVVDVSMNCNKLTSYGVKQQSVSESIKKMVG